MSLISKFIGSLAKRDYYDSPDGVWCIADAETDEFMELMDASQAADPWSGQFVYGKWTVYFFVVIVFVATLKHWYFVFHDRFVSEKPGSGSSMFFQLTAFNRYISYRKIPTFLCATCGLPRSLGTLLVTSACAIFTLAICLIPHPWYRACSGFGSPPMAIRADIIATAFVPFIFILSGKINIISSLTGISYERINVYHQTAGILCLVFSWLHAIPYYLQAARENDLANQNNDIYFLSGIPPIICLTLLVGLSLPILRKYFYELFLGFHWLLAILFYVGLFYHIQSDPVSRDYLIAAIVIGFVQMLYRGIFKGYYSPKGFIGPQIAEIKKINSTCGDNDCMEMSISTNANWSALQHSFVRFLDKPTEVVQSHPFSIMSSPEDKELRFLIKPKNGITKRIEQQVQNSTNGILKKKVQLDGPYGGLPRNLSAFDSVFLLASGTGITAILPVLNKAVENAEGVVRVRLDWCIRTKDSIQWISSGLNKVFEKAKNKTKLQLDINIHISHSSNDYANENDKSSVPSIDIGDANVDVNILNFRINVRDVIRNEYILGHRNIVVVSGSASMISETGNCVAGLQKAVFWDNCVEEIYLHSESFDW